MNRPPGVEGSEAAQGQGNATGAPRVSIIMNVRNGAAYVRDALDSVLAQTFGDWELVFWDNASTDATPEIAAGFGDRRMRYFRSPEPVPLGRVVKKGSSARSRAATGLHSWITTTCGCPRSSRCR